MSERNPDQPVAVGGAGLFEWLRRASLEDIVSPARHSEDFNGSRAEYIYLRVRLLAFVFAALSPLWIPIDYVRLDGHDFRALLSMRLLFSGLFLLLALWRARPYSMALARWRLLFLTVIPGLFYVGSRVVLGALPQAGVLAGYSFLPYLMVVLMAIFPLALIEGAAFAVVVGLPMVVVEALNGTLFSVPTLGNLWLLGLLAGIAVWAQLSQLHMLLRLYREATRDALTGLVNRRSLFKWLDVELGALRARDGNLSVMLFDLDLFKRVNDTYGHIMGDRVLGAFGKLVSRELGPHALIGRYGGEEFLAVLPGKTVVEAQAAAERVRAACHEVIVSGPDGRTTGFTTSVGVAELRRGESAEQLLSRVDQGLYHAKESGRDLVVAIAGS